MTATRAFRRARCALHGLSSDKDGRCALCRSSGERTRGPLVRHSSWLLGAAALCLGGLYWIERAPEPEPRLRVSASAATSRVARAARPDPITRSPGAPELRANDEPIARTARGQSEEDDAPLDERVDGVPSQAASNALDLVPAEDQKLGESGGVKPSGRVPAPRVPDPPAPAAADREPAAPDDPHDFDLPPAGQPQAPWRPPL